MRRVSLILRLYGAHLPRYTLQWRVGDKVAFYHCHISLFFLFITDLPRLASPLDAPSLLLYSYCIPQITRISRLLRRPTGNAIFVHLSPRLSSSINVTDVKSNLQFGIRRKICEIEIGFVTTLMSSLWWEFIQHSWCVINLMQQRVTNSEGEIFSLNIIHYQHFYNQMFDVIILFYIGAMMEIYVQLYLKKNKI